MTTYWLGVISKIILAGGVWILSDSVYSITLYINAPSYDGCPKQTWRKDHWVRLVRGSWALVFIWIGFVMEG